MVCSVHVCFTPSLFPLYKNNESIVVVIDVLRATSAICTAFDNGVEKIIPVATVDEARALKAQGFLAAAERDGMIVDGFDFGNSPYSYLDASVKGKTIALTTTNGTKAIHAAKDAAQLVIGSFLNKQALADYLIKQNKSIIMLCAGWKDKFNMEDTLFAGALTQLLVDSNKFSTDCDSAKAAMLLFSNAKNDLYAFLGDSSHRQRLGRLSLEKDIRFCLQTNQCSSIPILKGNELVKL